MNAAELDTAIKKNGLASAYLISGQEDDLRDRAVALIKAAVVGKEHGGLDEFNVDVLYGDETDASEILMRSRETPAFAARRLVLVKSAERISAKEGELLLSYLRAPSDTTTLVFVTPKLDGRMKFALALKERAVTVECSSLSESHLLEWIRAEAGRLGLRLQEEAVLLLRDMADSTSLSMAKRELEKLACYVPEGQIANGADVNALRGTEMGASVFDLASAIGTRNRHRALRILARNLEAGEAPLRVFGSLVWQYRQLWKAKEALSQPRGEFDAGRMLRLPPFKVREFVGLFSETHLRGAFRLFLGIDSRLKGAGATAPGVMLEGLLLDLCAREGTTAGRVAVDNTTGYTRRTSGKPVQSAQTISNVRPVEQPRR